MKKRKLALLIASSLVAGLVASTVQAAPTWKLRVPIAPDASKDASAPGDLSLSVSSVTFADQQVNYGQDTRTVVLTNSGKHRIEISSVTSDSSEFAATSNCNNHLLVAGATCAVGITFKPTGTPGHKTGALSIAHSGTGAATVSVAGFGAPAELRVPANLVFQGTPVGSTSNQSLSVANTGLGPVTLGVPTLSSGSGFRVASSNCPTLLDVGGTCTFNVEFAPVSRGQASGTLQLSSGAGTYSTVAAGEGQLGELGVSPAAGIAFGAVILNAQTDSSAVTVQNAGNLGVTALTMSAPQGYSIVSNNCSTSLAAGASCTFRVRFTPTVGKDYPGAISITAAGGLQASLPVSGTGLAASVAAGSPVDASYPVGIDSASGSTLKVVNNGGAPVTIKSMSVTSQTGNFQAAFAAGCSVGTVLQPGATCGVWTQADGAVGTQHSGAVTVDTSAGTLSFTRTFKVVSISTTYAALTPSASGSKLAYQVTYTNNSGVDFQPRNYSEFVIGGTAPSWGTFSGENATNFGWAGQGGCPATLVNGASCTMYMEAKGTVYAYNTYATTLQLYGGFPKTDSGVAVGSVASNNTALWLAPRRISYYLNP